MAQGARIANPNGKSSINVLSLGPDIWHLIAEKLDTREDLCNLCLVSKALYSLATLRLHKSVTLADFPRLNPDWSKRKDPWTSIHFLLCRLLDPTNESLRNAVREVEVGERLKPRYIGPIAALTQSNFLPSLVIALPNLRHFRMNCPITITEEFVNNLSHHQKQPELHLRGEDGSRVVTAPMPCVTTLQAQVDPFQEDGGPNRKMLGLQQLFFACPNLRSFSISLYGNYGGCVIRMPQFPQIHCFQMTGSEIFPSLEELSLNGYYHSINEWAHWRDKFPWSSLKSLSLGPQWNMEFLGLIKGHVTSLRSLTVQVFSDEGEDECSLLEDFLRSFNTLVSLTVKGLFLTSGAFSHHPNLEHFCLHTIESPLPGVSRKTLGGTELYDLDINCPQLESLELDVDRDGEWPEDILGIIATGFENLRHLTLHLQVGIRDHYKSRSPFPGEPQPTYEPTEPVLNEISAKELGQVFFQWRGQSKLRTLSLKTGESLRRFPQWAPFFAEWEKCYAQLYKLHAPLDPGDEPRLEDLTDMDPYYRTISQNVRGL